MTKDPFAPLTTANIAKPAYSISGRVMSKQAARGSADKQTLAALQRSKKPKAIPPEATPQGTEMLGFLKEKLAGGAKRMTGKTDMLEAACAMCALVGGADGDFSEDEATVALDRLLNHDVLSASFPPTQIEAAFEKQAKRLKQGMSGKIGLKREVEEARTKGKATHEDLEMLFCIAIDVAMADGSVGDKEMKALKDIGVALGGFDPAKYLA